MTITACLWLIVRSSPRELRDMVIALVLGWVLYAARRFTTRVAAGSAETTAA